MTFIRFIPYEDRGYFIYTTALILIKKYMPALPNK